MDADGTWQDIDNNLTLKNVKPNTDLEYVLSGNNVKESIIVKAAGSSYVYQFTLSLLIFP